MDVIPNLTMLSNGAGCGRKLDAASLRSVVSLACPFADPDLLVGADKADDAAVFRLSEDLALAFTADFVTPIVDDPYDYGRIAAANSLSDIYAMGATPRLALNIVSFPTNLLPLDYLVAILRGGADLAAEAGVTIAGGHTVDDREPKYGMAVVGFLKPGEEMSNTKAQPGDFLVLSKHLGTGIVATANKCGVAESSIVDTAVSSMIALNRDAALAARAAGVCAMTDITGFGLTGHLNELCEGSHVSAELWFERLPFLPGVERLATEGMVPRGTWHNLESAADYVSWNGIFAEHEMLMTVDAQTSGGLLIAVPEANAPALLGALRASRTQCAAVIGRLLPHGKTNIVIRRSAPSAIC